MENVLCPGCGQSFKTYPSRIAQGRGRFCSRACNAKINLLRKNATRHGLSGTATYRSWNAMLQRCHNPNSYKFPTYGGAGVKVCDAWQSFDHFLKDMGLRPDGMTLDRIDGQKGYEPGNCRWATISQQQNNQKRTIRVKYFDREYTLSELSSTLGLSKNTLLYRIKIGWDQSEWGKRTSSRKVQPRLHGVE